VKAPPATVVVYTAQGTFKLSGSDWAALVNDPTRKATLLVAVQSDLAALLGINPLYIVIFDVSVGSLIVNYAILDGAGKTAAQLTQQLATAQNNTSWLTTVKSTYASVSNESITVLSFTAVAVSGGTTAAPATTTVSNTTLSPTTAGTAVPSINAAPATSVVAAAVLALAAVVLAM